MFKPLLIALLIMISTNVLGEDAIGMVVASRGENMTADGRVLSQGGYVFENDVILTATRSFVVLQLTDGSKVTVRPDTELILASYAYNTSEPDGLELSLVSGGLRIVTGAIAKSSPDNYKLDTPVALMGVRGTEFSIMLCGDGVCEE